MIVAGSRVSCQMNNDNGNINAPRAIQPSQICTQRGWAVIALKKDIRNPTLCHLEIVGVDLLAREAFCGSVVVVFFKPLNFCRCDNPASFVFFSTLPLCNAGTVGCCICWN